MRGRGRARSGLAEKVWGWKGDPGVGLSAISSLEDL